MIVYKYLHPNRVDDVLRRGLIRFTQPAALNDPFEVRANLCEIRQYFERMHKEVGKGRGTPATEDDLQSTQQFITDTVGRWNEDNVSNLVFLCLSKKRNEMLMWSHYCDSHRGLVIGFDSTHPFFTVAQSGVKSILREVVYSPSRPVMPAPDQNSIEFFRTNRNILTKSHHWAYEEELRMCASPDAADITEGPTVQPIYLFRFPPESLVEVVLGHRMLVEDGDGIVEIIRDRYVNAKLYQTALNESEYDLDIVPYS